MPEPELSLVTRSRAGDRQSFEELVRRTARLLFARLYLKTCDPHRAQDLVQETLLIAWKRLPSIDDPARFRSWLLTIADRVAIDSARHESRKKRKGERENSAAIDDVVDSSSSVAQSAEINEERNKVLALLDGLPEEYRAVLSLRYLAGADYAEISKQLALTNGSLRGLLQRGLKMLREKMNAHT